jgi:diguanylate cyclase (GGDEF)-like protein/PAS domain S-box-containing protein
VKTRRNVRIAKEDPAEALRRSEERLKSLLELSTEWYWEQDESYRFTLILGASLAQAGFDPRSHVGTTRWGPDSVPLGDGGSWERHRATLDAREPFSDFVFRRIDAQGEMRYISVSGQPMFEGKRFTGYRGIAKDVTASMRAEQLLRLEHMVARCVAGADSAAAALKEVIRSTCETQGWECGRYFGRDDTGDVLVMREFWHVPNAALETFIEQSREITYGPGAGLIGEVWQSGSPLWVTDIGKDSRLQKGIARQAGMHGTFIFPVVSEGKAIGVLSFHSGKVREPDERLLQAVGVIGSQIGQFLQRKLAEERIQYLATHDGLTGLPNRVMFGQLLNLAIQTARRYDRSFAVMFIDLDRFKFVNDTLGHEAGDKLLQEISGRFKEILRASDVVARLGGDEFVILVQEVSGRDPVTAVARKLISAALKPVVVFGQECRVTASIGICLYPGDAEDEQTLMKNADIAMYHAKEEGKNNFQFYSRDIKQQSIERLTLETSLRRALERSEFSLHYQAKLDFKSGRINGVEALLRWRHPDLGLVSPGTFIPIAEETGLIVAIGTWVLKEVCAQNVAWQREGLPPVCASVNLSARQFNDEHFLGDVAAALEQSGMKPELLELELTEGMVMQNPEQAAKRLSALKRLGVRVAIDDFGVGYSSLAQIRRFPIDTLKVDRSFIRDLAENAEDRAITEAIIAMGKTLSLTVVAEGVETKEQESFLRSHACDEMQGYYFSRPVPHDQFASFLRGHVAAPR